jgi:hypothetical protein
MLCTENQQLAIALTVFTRRFFQEDLFPACSMENYFVIFANPKRGK